VGLGAWGREASCFGKAPLALLADVGAALGVAAEGGGSLDGSGSGLALAGSGAAAGVDGKGRVLFRETGI
jgi:hypothetical protein